MPSCSTTLKLALVLALVASFVFAGLLGTAIPARANHDTVPWSGAHTITGGGTINNYSAATLDDGHGNLYVFYINTPPAGNNLYVRKYQDVGPTNSLAAVAGFPVLVNSAAANVVDYSLTYPYWTTSVTIDRAGRLYAAWTHTNTGTSRQDVYVSRSTDGGATWSLNTLVNANTADEWDFAPAIITAPDGTLYVVWSQLRGGLYSVTFASSTNQDNSWSTQKNISEPSSSPSATTGAPSIAVDSLGQLYVAYARYVPAFGRYVANMTRSTDGGATWTTPALMDPRTTANGYSPQLMVDRANRVHMAWFDNRYGLGGNPRIFYVQSPDGFATWTAPVPISQGLTLPSGEFAFHFVTEGDTILTVWDSSASGVQSTVVSADNGATWYPEASATYAHTPSSSAVTVDQNGTFYSLFTMSGLPNSQVNIAWWHSPPSKPLITTVTPGSGSLTVAWTAPPEVSVVGYRVWRSNDGSTYNVVGFVNAPSTSFTGSGLANGTYWFKIEALDQWGYVSHPSPPWSGTLGPTVAQLAAEIAALQAQLNSANANLASLQTQLNNLQNQLNSMKATDQANYTALKNQLNAIQSQLDTLRTQQATQTISYANLTFEIIVVVLLVVLLLNQMRKPKSPQMMMAQSGETPKKPDEEL